ncbi:MAG: radical SAM protein [Desulfovibrionaceae bacterium]|nr:radical SAM protein [Desulfovibrionaceae bacterium]MBF0513833.1 radical SAM protein [Desulfovibrionaceae bacterium]
MNDAASKPHPANLLPDAPWLDALTEIWLDAGVVNTPVAKRVVERLPGLPRRVIEGGQAPPGPERAGPGNLVLHLKKYRGRFLRPCPGTKNYRCCGYRIVHIGENCPLACSYCILRGYFRERTLTVFADTEAMFARLDVAFSRDKNRLFRVGTGQFTDSLALEAATGLSRDLVGFLAAYDNVRLELKSKIVDLSWLDAARPGSVLPAWSLNTPETTRREEPGAAGIEQRLAAAKRCAEAGFKVCLHFDPLILAPGWEEGYARVAAMIFDYLKPDQIAYVSLGSFRTMPELFARLAAQPEPPRCLGGEFVTGLDGKKRLLRPLRVAQFRHVAGLLRRGGLDRQLYLCMESDEVWKAVFGHTPRKLGGLANHLLARAFWK